MTADPQPDPLTALPSESWMDSYHPLEYGTPGTLGHMLRCPTCEEWSPCRVRIMYDALVARLTASPAAESGQLETALREALEAHRGALITVAQWDSWASEWLAKHSDPLDIAALARETPR